MVGKWVEGYLYRNGKTEILLNNDNTSYLKIQAWIDDDSEFEFKVVGRLSKNNVRRSEIIATRDADADEVQSIDNNGVYTLDITGYYDISIEVVNCKDPNKKVIVWGVILQEL